MKNGPQGRVFTYSLEETKSVFERSDDIHQRPKAGLVHRRRPAHDTKPIDSFTSFTKSVKVQ